MAGWRGGRRRSLPVFAPFFFLVLCLLLICCVLFLIWFVLLFEFEASAVFVGDGEATADDE